MLDREELQDMILEHIEDINLEIVSAGYEKDSIRINAELLKAKSIALLGLTKLTD